MIAPDGRHVAFQVVNNSKAAFAVMDADGGHEKLLLEHARAKMRWRTAEELLFSEGPEDARSGLGPAFRMVNVTTGAVSRPPHPDLPIDPTTDALLDWEYVPSLDSILYVTYAFGMKPALVGGALTIGPCAFRLFSLTEGADRVIATRDQIDYAAKVLTISPNATRVAYSSRNAIKVMDLMNPGEDRSLTTNNVRVSVSWSPSGKHLISCNANGQCMVANVDTSEWWPLVAPSAAGADVRWFDANWSPDGSFALVSRGGVRMDWRAFEGVTYEAVTKLMTRRRVP
jgi:hypothetical protein